MSGRRSAPALARRAWLLRGAALAAAVLVAAGCGDTGTPTPAASAASGPAATPAATSATTPTPPPTPTPAPIVHSVPTGAAGTEFEVPPTDPSIAGWRLVVPEGALASDAELTISAMPDDASAAAIAESEPALFPAFGDAVLAALPDGAISPIFGPVRALLSATQVGPTLELGPSGTSFAAPVEVVVPASVVAGAGDAVLVAAIRGVDGGWSAVVPESRADGLHVPVAHFSGVRIFSILERIVTNPGARVDRKLVLAAREKLESAPLADAERAILSAVACDGAGTVTVDQSKLPTSLAQVLNYLGRDSGSIAQGRPGDEVVEDMNKYLQARIAEREKVTAPRDPARKHFITMEELYAEALRQTGSDAFQALLAVHGVLRDNRTQAGQAPSPYLQAIEVLRGDGGDEDGARYHFVGAAIYAYLYAHQADAKTLSVLSLTPEDTVRLEEAWISGDIESDVTEYAVDLAGIRFGRRLYDHFRATSEGAASPLAAQVCTTMEGSVDLAIDGHERAGPRPHHEARHREHGVAHVRARGGRPGRPRARDRRDRPVDPDAAGAPLRDPQQRRPARLRGRAAADARHVARLLGDDDGADRAHRDAGGGREASRHRAVPTSRRTAASRTAARTRGPT